jgi:hypothetical protein
MRKFHSIATLCGDGLRPELHAYSIALPSIHAPEFLVREAGPDPASESAHKRCASSC